MELNSTMLVSEFESQGAAQSALRVLKAAGIDLADMHLRKANWITEVDPSGKRTISEAAGFGAMIGAACGVLATVAVAASSLTHFPEFSARVFGLGAITFLGPIGIGATLGMLFGKISIHHATPDWVEPEYGDHLRHGACLLVVEASPAIVDLAQHRLADTAPVSLRMRRRA
jgi:hypothetical protein